ncbi:MAG: hypothetical protein ACI92Z_002706, partial [Paracoccaceae bacterium]
MFRISLVSLFTCLCGPAVAQDWPMRSGDAPLSQIEAHDLIGGRTLTFYDNGRAKFSVGGAYSYTYADNGGSAFGRFDVDADGKVCIAFANGFGRCDMFVQNHGRLV